MKTIPLAAILGLLVISQLWGANEPATTLPYGNDPEIVKMLQELEPGASMMLPALKYLYNGEKVDTTGRRGPYSRDFTTMMAYAPDRQTALYCGGNHGSGRMNDVWEFHLGSNTWHCLQPAIGGDHAIHKNALMFLPQRFTKNPQSQFSEKEQEQIEAAKKFWHENVILTNGHFVTREKQAPLLVGHTWDTLVYEPNLRLLIQGFGAHNAASPWLHHWFTGMPLEEVKSLIGKNEEGKTYRPTWTFDPVARQWHHYASEDPISNLRGMGTTMCYISDWKKIIYYAAAQNVVPASFQMSVYDAVNDKWEDLRPNGGKRISDLVVKEHAAPTSEQQTAYSPKHKMMVAVIDKQTYGYDIEKNEWQNLNSEIPFKASDSSSVFAWDTAAGRFIVANINEGRIAVLDMEGHKWDEIKPNGPGIPKAQYGTGKGYYDPLYNVLVIQRSSSDKMWVYRHAAGQ